MEQGRTWLSGRLVEGLTPTEAGPDAEAGGRSKRRKKCSELPALCVLGQVCCKESLLLLPPLTVGCYMQVGTVDGSTRELLLLESVYPICFLVTAKGTVNHELCLSAVIGGSLCYTHGISDRIAQVDRLSCNLQHSDDLGSASILCWNATTRPRGLRIACLAFTTNRESRIRNITSSGRSEPFVMP